MSIFEYVTVIVICAVLAFEATILAYAKGIIK